MLSACGDSSGGAADGSRGSAGSGARPDGTLRLAVIPKGTTHEFWQSIEEGARRAADAAGVEIVWRGPLKENDRAAQIEIVQQFVTQGVDGIALAPLDAQALVLPVALAKDRNIPVVIFDSGLRGTPGADFASFVATDNLEGGRMAARELARQMGEEGPVVVLRYQVGSASTDDRERGFLETIAGYPRIEVISSDQYGGASIATAKQKALNMLDVLRRAKGIFTPNESVTVGMLRTLQQENLVEGRTFVGFDSSTVLAQALRDGEIDALVLQDPVDMGARAVETLVRAVRGEPVESHIDTTVALATRDNLDDPTIARLLR
ncbi:MAG: substrate-binding domain-containing protein [Planctomycetes bacterium]|nr:substrate-binding domain-containing protein [Planctomycetota bacterium]